MYKLLLKIHNKTGLKYLCVTKKQDHDSYKGSGVYWSQHIKKHGYDVTTIVMYQRSSKDSKFIQYCIAKSIELNIVNDNSFANLMNECANSTRTYKKDSIKTIERRRSSLKSFWENNEYRRKIYSERSINFWNSDYGICKKICCSIASSNFWNSEEGSLKKKEHADRQKNLTSDKREKLSDMLKEIWNSLPEEIKKEHADKISSGRINMTQEAKDQRAIKVSESFKKSDKRKSYNDSMKENRKGQSNPASKMVYWDEHVFSTCSDFSKWCKENKITKKFADYCFKSEQYESRFKIGKSKIITREIKNEFNGQTN